MTTARIDLTQETGTSGDHSMTNRRRETEESPKIRGLLALTSVERRRLLYALTTGITLLVLGITLSSNLPGSHSTAPLPGTDANQNGIRDDIDDLLAARIKENSFSDQQIQSLQALAAGLQDIQVAPTMNPQTTVNLTAANSRLHYCLIVEPSIQAESPVPSTTLSPQQKATEYPFPAFYSPIVRTAREIEAKTMNTPDRQSRYLAYVDHLNDITFSKPPTRVCRSIRRGDLLI